METLGMKDNTDFSEDGSNWIEGTWNIAKKISSLCGDLSRSKRQSFPLIILMV